MLSNTNRKILGLIATTLLVVFILGLAHSISTGFAGFYGGLPFWIISIAVLSLALYDLWDQCFRNK